jgi:hypothetical protein
MCKKSIKLIAHKISDEIWQKFSLITVSMSVRSGSVSGSQTNLCIGVPTIKMMIVKSISKEENMNTNPTAL